MKAAVATGIIVLSCITVVVLWRISDTLHLRGFHSLGESLLGHLAWLVSSGLLVGASLLLGRAWRRRAAPVRFGPAAWVAIAVPILAVTAVLSFDYPIWWPNWLDSEFAGAVAILAGGLLGVFLLPASEVDTRLPQVGRWMLCLWSVLVLVAGTGSVLFLE